MTVFEAIILGIIQGISEFLPISSSGHLGLAKYFFGIEEEGLFFIIAIHIATLVPVIIIYWADIWALIKKPFQKMTLLLIIATIPAAIIGIFFEDTIETALSSIRFIAFGLIITGIALMLTDRLPKGHKDKEKITRLDSLLIGIAQAVAVFPGISRSGSTITAGLFRGIDRAEVAKFSFLMSIPAILGATLLQVISIMRGDLALESINWGAVTAGFIAAMLSGYLAIQFLLSVVKKAKLKYFSYYVFLVAAIVLISSFIVV